MCVRVCVRVGVFVCVCSTILTDDSAPAVYKPPLVFD